MSKKLLAPFQIDGRPTLTLVLLNQIGIPDMLAQLTARNKHFCNTDIVIGDKDDLTLKMKLISGSDQLLGCCIFLSILVEPLFC